MNKVVINVKYGGFGLSTEAAKILIEQGMEDIEVDKNDWVTGCWDLCRHDPRLVEVVEKLDNKKEVWLKDSGGKEVLVELWDQTFSVVAPQFIPFSTVLQIDNARVVKKDNGTVHVSAECYSDSERAIGFTT